MESSRSSVFLQNLNEHEVESNAVCRDRRIVFTLWRKMDDDFPVKYLRYFKNEEHDPGVEAVLLDYNELTFIAVSASG